ncbi:MAG TPA: type II toxin-antitoxin system prevent-host-death family antitoxin [Chloroflexota bacterium]|nr:type II toxin-antitoxin system prevent-host-death family antitoxin [Chloroflexota bacterium]
MRQIGVRDLRQNASKWLRCVKEGESFEVTERGRTIAMLVPAPPEMTTIERLIASGQIIPATRDLLDVKPLPPEPGKPLPSQILEEMRADER